MNIGIAGSGPAADAVRAACADVDATVDDVEPDSLAAVDLAVVTAPAGSSAFAAANEAVLTGEGPDRWIAVEIGGLGGQPLAVDAAVTVFDGAGCYDCLRARVAANVTDEERADRATGDRSAVRFAGAVAGRELVRLLAGAERGGTVIEVPGPERTFLPVPGCACGTGRDRTIELSAREVPLDDALERAERALDERVGAIREVGERESFPVPYYIAATSDTTVFSDARAAEFAAGVDPDWDRAFMKALGEGLERYAAGVYRSGEFLTAPERTRRRAVSPREFVRPADSEVPDPDEPIQWVEGRDLDADEPAALPAEFVHYPPPTERYKPPITTGLGLGNAGVEAILAGLYEVLERDATMLAWYSTFEPLGLAVDDDNVAELRKRARAEGLEVSLLLVTQDVDVPVVAAAVRREAAPEGGRGGAGGAGGAGGTDADDAGHAADVDPAWPKFAMGSGADLDPAAAARSALAEALQNWMELRAMGPAQAAAEEGAIGEYADFPRAAREFVDVDATVPAESVGPASVPAGEAELAAVVERAVDAGLTPYTVRLTTRDLEALGFEAYRTLLPSAQPLFTGEPFFGRRARDVPRDLGFEPDLDRPYHPFP